MRAPLSVKASAGHSVRICFIHVWHPTLLFGYVQCTRCQQLAACRVCVPEPRGKPLLGYCRTHQPDEPPPQSEEEVLA